MARTSDPRRKRNVAGAFLDRVLDRAFPPAGTITLDEYRRQQTTSDDTTEEDDAAG